MTSTLEQKNPPTARRRARRPLPLRRKLAFAAIAFGISLAAAALLGEAAVRLLLSWKTRGDLGEAARAAIRDPNQDLKFIDLIHPVANPNLVYRLRPGTRGRFLGQPVEVNSLGMRGPEPLAPEAGGRVVRVVGLGDSHTFGWGVANDETYLAQLRRALGAVAAPGVKIETLNFGVPGYNSVMEVESFIQQGLALKPDAVTIQYCLNDCLLPNFLTTRDYLTNFRKSYLYGLLRGRAGGGSQLIASQYDIIDMAGQPLEMDPAQAPPQYRQLVGWQRLAEAYKRLKAECDRIGAPLFVLSPTEMPWESFKWGQAHPTRDPHYDKIRALCAELKIPFIETFGDVYDFVQAHGFRAYDMMVFEDGHPNPMKHAIFAQRLLGALAPGLAKSGAIDPAKILAQLAAMRVENEKRAAEHKKYPVKVIKPEDLLD